MFHVLVIEVGKRTFNVALLADAGDVGAGSGM